VKPLTRAELEALTALAKRPMPSHSAAYAREWIAWVAEVREAVPRLIAEVRRTRELLRGLMDYHNAREACVHMEGPQFCQEATTYLKETE